MHCSATLFRRLLLPTAIWVTFLLFFPLSIGQSFAQVVISEVMWMGSDMSTVDEWVEIGRRASGVGRRDVSGWRLVTQKSSGEESIIVEFASGTTIGSGEFLLVSNYGEGASRLSIEPDIVTTAVSLSNSSLLLRLYNASGAIVDQVGDGSSPFAGANPSGTGAKASMERIDLSSSGTIASNWKTATDSLNFDSGSLIYGTPGMTNGILSSSSASSASSSEAKEDASSGSVIILNIFITEVLANPAGTDDEEWLEIGNLGTGAINISGWRIETGASSAGYIIASGVSLQPGDHMSFPKSITSLVLGNKGGEVLLWSGSLLIDQWAYPETGEEISFGRGPEDSSVFLPFCISTMGKANEIITLDPQIFIQSGQPIAEDKVSINLQTIVEQGSIASSICHWDYGDGYSNDSCNPPSHSFTDPGTYLITLSLTSFCGSTLNRTLQIEVLGEPKGSSSSSEKSLASSASSCSPSTSTGILITAALPNPSGDEKTEEWIELFNETDSKASLCGWLLDDGPEGSKPYSLDTISISPGDFVRLKRSETKISLNNSDDSARLIDPKGKVAFELYWKSTVEDRIERPALARGRRIRARVLEVIDGDTFDVEILEDSSNLPPSIRQRWLKEEKKSDPSLRVRLIGIDTPETVHLHRPEEEWGAEASAFLSELVEGEEVILEFDSDLWDAYDRLLAYVYVGDELAQAQVLREGLSTVYDRFPFSRLDEFLEYQEEAKAARLGLWSTAVNEEEQEETPATEGPVVLVSSKPAKVKYQNVFSSSLKEEIDEDNESFNVFRGLIVHAEGPETVVPEKEHNRSLLEVIVVGFGFLCALLAVGAARVKAKGEM